jgi:hypothetical protein
MLAKDASDDVYEQLFRRRYRSAAREATAAKLVIPDIGSAERKGDDLETVAQRSSDPARQNPEAQLLRMAKASNSLKA